MLPFIPMIFSFSPVIAPAPILAGGFSFVEEDLACSGAEFIIPPVKPFHYVVLIEAD